MNWTGGLRKSYSKKKSLDRLKKAYSQRVVASKSIIPKSYDTSKSQDIKSLEAYKQTFTIPKRRSVDKENDNPSIFKNRQMSEMKQIICTPPKRKMQSSFVEEENCSDEIPTYEYTKKNNNGSEINICTFGQPYIEEEGGGGGVIKEKPLLQQQQPLYYNNNISPPPPPTPLYVSTFSQAKQVYGNKKRNIFNTTTTTTNTININNNNTLPTQPSIYTFYSQKHQEGEEGDRDNDNNDNDDLAVLPSSFLTSTNTITNSKYRIINDYNKRNSSDISKYYMDYQYNKYNNNNNNEISDEDKWIERHSNNNNNSDFKLSIDNNNNREEEENDDDDDDESNTDSNIIRQNILQLKSDNSFTRTSSLQYILDCISDNQNDKNKMNELNSYLYLLQGTKYREEAQLLYDKLNEINDDNNSNINVIKEEEKEEVIMVVENRDDNNSNNNEEEKTEVVNNEIQTTVINNNIEIENDEPLPIKRKLIDCEEFEDNSNSNELSELIIRPKTSHCKRIRNNDKSLFLAITPSKSCLFHYHEYDQLSYLHSPIQLKRNESELLTIRYNCEFAVINSDIVDMKINKDYKSISCCYKTVETNAILQSSEIYAI